MMGEVSSPNLGRQPFVSGVLMYISRAVNVRFELDTLSDNRPVCLASNFQEAETTSIARRLTATKRSHVYISQPHVVKPWGGGGHAHGSKHIGVDLLDRSINDCKTQLQSQKWWWCRLKIS